MSVYDKDLFGKSKLETAIQRIKFHCKDKKTLVAFSGGKDSQCCYHLAKMAGIDFFAQYSITRFEPPELLSFIRENYPDVTFRRAYKRTLVEDIVKSGLPNRWSRWCCDAKHRKTEGFEIAIVGIRWAESARRKMRWSDFGRKQDGTFYVCPIVDWTDEDVWEFLNSQKIPHCSLYDEGFTRIGCVCCPLAPGKGDEKRWPKTAQMLRLAYERRCEFANNGGVKSQKTIDTLNSLPRDKAFENWLKNGSIVIGDKSEDLPCLFAGTGFSESDGGESD